MKLRHTLALLAPPSSTGAIHRRGSWRSLRTVEAATLEWTDRFNNHRLLEPIGNALPAEAEASYYATLDEVPKAA